MDFKDKVKNEILQGLPKGLDVVEFLSAVSDLEWRVRCQKENIIKTLNLLEKPPLPCLSYNIYKNSIIFDTYRQTDYLVRLYEACQVLDAMWHNGEASWLEYQHFHSEANNASD